MTPRACVASLLLASLVVLTGCQQGQFIYDSRAVILDVLADQNRLMVHHEPIDGLMEASQMSFTVAETVDASLLSAGDKIAFTLNLSQDGLAITAVERLAADTPLELGAGRTHGAMASASAMAGMGHGHGSDVEGRSGFTTHVAGISGVDFDNPPSGSPVGRALAIMGDTYLHVAYSRPFKRGRVIFGGLVGYNQVWPMGAHHATEITLTGPVMIAGQRLEAGTYALFATPDPETWTIHVNRTLGMHMADLYDSANDVLTIEAPVETLSETVQQHTIDFEPNGSGMDLRVSWDQTRVRVPLRPAS